MSASASGGHRRRRPAPVVFTSRRKTLLAVGVLAWIAVVTVLILREDTDASFEVAVARSDIAAGATVSQELVEPVAVPNDSALTATLVPYDEFARAPRLIALRPIAPGQPIAHADIERR